MNELELPNPAPKSCEQEKWKAMVDSVIEFISASRTMLYALNERLKNSEQFKEEEKRKLEDEQTKLTFYKECLNLKIIPEPNMPLKKSVKCESNLMSKESGDMKNLMQNFHGKLKGNANKITKTDQIEVENSNKSVDCMRNEQTTVETQSSNVDFQKTSSTQIPVSKNAEIMTNSTLDLLKEIPNRKSRIPKTKSYVVEEKNKSSSINRPPSEGTNINRGPNSTKKTPREATYRKNDFCCRL